MKSKSKSDKVAAVRITCRTCLESSEISSSTNITKECMLGKTFKEILQFFIPQMITSPLVDEFICPNCTRRIRSFTSFIEDCIRVEKFLTDQTKKKQKKSEGQAVKAQTGSIAKNAPLNLVYITTPLNNQNQGETDPLQPINYVLLPGATGDSIMSLEDDVVSISEDDALEPEIIIIPEPKLQVETSDGNVEITPVPQTKEHIDLANAAAGNRLCRTCGDVFSSNDWTMVECLKCNTNEREAPVILINSEGSDDNVSEIDYKAETASKRVTSKSKEPDLFEDIRKQFRDTVISICQTPEEIEAFLQSFSTNPIRTINYGPYHSTKNKRILFLGNSKSQCEKCKKLLKNPRRLRAHFREAHSTIFVPELDSDEDSDTATEQPKKTFTCPFCDVHLNTALLLVEHLRSSHTIQKPYKCERCGKEFCRKEVYTEHLKRFKNGKGCTFRKCRYCSESMSKSELAKHMECHKNIVCDQCGRSFLHPHNFKLHYATHETKEPQHKPKVNKEQESHLCPVCGKLFNHSGSLKQHIKIHEERSRDYICHMCPKTFLTSYSLKNHLATAHGDKNYTCPICGVKVKTNAALVNHHNLKHSDSYTHVCKACGKGFSRGDYYRRHLRSHAVTDIQRSGKKKYNYSVKIESKPVKCKYCLKLFKNVYLLRTHLLSHVTSMRYKCKFCNMTFANTGTRFRHQKRHADPNFDLSCTVCWKRMKTKEELEVHLARHDDSRKYECSVCGELVASKYLLRHHVSERHIPQEEVEKEKQSVLSSALEEFLL